MPEGQRASKNRTGFVYEIYPALECSIFITLRRASGRETGASRRNVDPLNPLEHHCKIVPMGWKGALVLAPITSWTANRKKMQVISRDIPFSYSPDFFARNRSQAD